MKLPRLRLPHGRERGRGALTISVLVHLALALALTQMVIRYPVTALFRSPTVPPVTPERVEYVTVVTPPASSQSARARPVPRGGAPAPLLAPTSIPTQVPAPLPTVPVPAEAPGGTGNGLGVTGGEGIATGVVPGLPDSRIKLTPQAYFAMPTKAPAEKIDSLIADALGVYIDSLEATSHQRKPGDWTFTTKDGRKYGWDQSGIRLGKFTIPNALLALVPMNVQANPTLHGRLDDAQRADVLFQGRLQITEDQFKAAVKRIRARNEKLHEEQMRTRPDSTSR